MIGFIGLGNMGFPMAGRLAAAGRELVVYDTRGEVVERATKFGARGAASPRQVADEAEIVMASLPSLPASEEVAGEVAGGTKIELFVDLSTVGSDVAQRNHAALAAAGVAALDAPVSGGVSGAQRGALAIMVSGPRAAFATAEALLDELGRPFFVGEKPGAAQTMKLVNNLMAATTLAATAEVMVMGVKAGLDAQTMLDVLNAGSGGTHASRRLGARRSHDGWQAADKRYLFEATLALLSTSGPSDKPLNTLPHSGSHDIVRPGRASRETAARFALPHGT